MKKRFWLWVALVFVAVNVVVFAVAQSRGGILFGSSGKTALSAGLRVEMVKVEKPWLEQVNNEDKPAAPVVLDLKQGKKQLDTALEQAAKKVEAEVPQPVLCMQWGPLLSDQVQRVKDSLAQWEGRWQEVQRRVPVGYVVYLPKERVDAGQGISELAALGVTDTFYMAQSGELQGSISLGLFRDETRARIHQAEMIAKGVEGVDVNARLGPTRTFIELYGVQNEMDSLQAIYRLNRRSNLSPCDSENTDQS